MMTGMSLPRRSRRHTSKPSSPGEHHVEHHDVRGGVAEVAKRRLTGLGGAHPVAETAQS
jgi:hypothetical protein